MRTLLEVLQWAQESGPGWEMWFQQLFVATVGMLEDVQVTHTQMDSMTHATVACISLIHVIFAQA